MKRIIGHLDMDSFFASVEERDKPRLAGLPIVVGADPAEGRGRGVVSTANYRARTYGIHSAMPITKAWHLSEIARRGGKPAAVFITPNFSRYESTSRRIIGIVQKYLSIVEMASIDEFYLELSSAGNFEKAEELCRQIKKEIFEKEKLTASIGIGPNKLIAKIASDYKKPDGFTVVYEEDAEVFLETMPIRKIPGIGPKTELLLFKQGIKTIRDLRKVSKEKLRDFFGKWGEAMYEKSRGRDDAPIETEREAKSIGEQETFSRDTNDVTFITDRLRAVCTSIFSTFEKSGFTYFKTVALIVRFHDFETKTRAHTLKEKSSSAAVLEFEALKLLSPFLDKRENSKKKLFRLIGVRLEKLGE